MEGTELKLKSSVFFIEANSFEMLSLWKDYEKQTSWEQDNMGFAQTIGFIDGDNTKPVVVCFNFAKLFEQRICFYNVTSRYSDMTMVEDWIKKHYPVIYDNTRAAMTDAMNFHNAVNQCKTLANSNLQDVD